jgi:hypothetical protein
MTCEGSICRFIRHAVTLWAKDNRLLRCHHQAEKS